MSRAEWIVDLPVTSRQLILTADDFGMSKEVNDAVEEAHRKGVLSAASLVVTGDAADDAVVRARRMPDLGVGLHLALVSARPALPPEQIPDLLDRDLDGLGSSPERVGASISLSRKSRDQARAETRAQLELFRRTGLPLDHLDGHWHFHQHPSIVNAIVDLAPEFGIRAVRVPYEPAFPSWRAASHKRLLRRVGVSLLHRPLAARMWSVLGRAGIVTNDWFFGMNDGGAVSSEVLLGYIDNLPLGVTEIGLHPATRTWRSPNAPPPAWRVADELRALVDPAVIAACRSERLQLVTFSDLVAERTR